LRNPCCCSPSHHHDQEVSKPAAVRYACRERNADFLNAELFSDAFLAAGEPYKDKVGFLMFEFGRFYQTDFPSVNEFSETLNQFLERLPKSWPYGVQIRNKDYLKPDYFATLAKQRVAHVHNSWSAMPPVCEQLALPGSITNPELVGARFLIDLFIVPRLAMRRKIDVLNAQAVRSDLILWHRSHLYRNCLLGLSARVSRY
jgi:hypothetical protein